MKTAPRILLIALAFTGLAVAAAPHKAPISKYTKLWTDSPFTAKPPPPEAGPIVNPLEDYGLIGVSPISGGYRVTLLHKKEPDNRITVESGDTTGDFKILGVTRKPGDPLGTVVRMSNGPSTGTVSFDEKQLVLVKPPAAKAKKANLPRGVRTTAKSGTTPVRQPRPRVVPPPTNTAKSSSNNKSQRPTRRSGR